MTESVHRASPSAPRCNRPECGACASGRGQLHRYDEGHRGHTVCGLRLRQPTDKPKVDRDGKAVVRASIDYTVSAARTSCPDCLTASHNGPDPIPVLDLARRRAGDHPPTAEDVIAAGIELGLITQDQVAAAIAATAESAPS